MPLFWQTMYCLEKSFFYVVFISVQAVRAMRFDIGANKKKVPDAETVRDRVIAEEELAKALEEEDDGL